MKKKIDRRTKYTLDVIKDTVLKLSEKKEINKITVTEICKIADINRATFYKYYRDIYKQHCGQCTQTSHQMSP